MKSSSFTLILVGLVLATMFVGCRSKPKITSTSAASGKVGQPFSYPNRRAAKPCRVFFNGAATQHNEMKDRADALAFFAKNVPAARVTSLSVDSIEATDVRSFLALLLPPGLAKDDLLNKVREASATSVKY